MTNDKRKTGPTPTGHQWKNYGLEVAACRLCGAEPWGNDGRAPCPVTNRRGDVQFPTQSPPPESLLTVADFADHSCDNPSCGVLAGIALATVQIMEETLERGYGMRWNELCDAMIDLTREHWGRLGVQGTDAEGVTLDSDPTPPHGTGRPL